MKTFLKILFSAISFAAAIFYGFRLIKFITNRFFPNYISTGEDTLLGL